MRRRALWCVALTALGCASHPLQLRRVVLYQNGVGHFEHKGRVVDERMRFFVKDYEVADVLKTLTVVSPDGASLTPTVHTATVEEPTALAEHEKTGGKEPEARTAIEVIFSGGSGKAVSVSYAVPTPAWRATYRVILPEVGKTQALLQGWATLHNTSDEDWNNVELVLATGAPFTYAIDLHSPEFVARPDLNGKLIKPATVGAVGSSRGRPGDRDGDGISDTSDLCPEVAEDPDNFEDSDGCPDPDNDKDRILDADDQCPNDSETYNGMEDEDGCPDRGRVVVTDTKLEILDKIYFQANSAELRTVSKPIADAIVATLQGNPGIQLIEIQGHAADNERKPDALGQRRADAVAAYLVGHGVDPARLQVRSYGGHQPIDPRKNAMARAKNQRVEFLILKRSDEDTGTTTRTAPRVTTRKRSTQVATTTDVAGTVRYRLPIRVSIPRGQSTLVPIVNRHVEGSEVYLFRPDSNAPGSDIHPFRAARIVNTKGSELPTGPVAIFASGSFAGEGILSKLFADEVAYIPYATDSSARIQTTVRSEVQPSRILSIDNGRARVEDFDVVVTEYSIETGHKSPSTAYLQHERRSGYETVNAPVGSEKSAGGLLVPLPIRPEATGTLTLRERRPSTREISLASWRSDTLKAYLSPDLPAVVASALTEIIKLRRELVGLDDRQRQVSKKRYRAISRAQQIRANLRAIGKNAPDLRRRLLTELSDVDKLSKTLLTEVTKMDEERTKKSAILTQKAQSLTWKRTP